jgi:hypothetical protein
MNFFTIIYSLYLVIIALGILKIAKWTLEYLRIVRVINKIPGIKMLPFLGNAHNLKKKHGT